MSNGKLKLPNSFPVSLPAGETDIPSACSAEMLKTQRAGIEANAKIETARLQVAQEAISMVKSFFDVLKSHNELEATRIEWEGRVNTEENALRKALVNLESTKEQNFTRREELNQSRASLNRLLSLFDDVREETSKAEISEETKNAQRQFLLQLSDKIVQLRK
jgi:hypothetical protein